jgi:hypothetical protein
MFYGKAYKNWESLQRLICDLFSQNVHLKKVLRKDNSFVLMQRLFEHVKESKLIEHNIFQKILLVICIVCQFKIYHKNTVV